MSLKTQTVQTSIAAAMLLVFVFVVRPSQLPVGLLVVPFVLLAWLYYQITVLLGLIIDKLRGVSSSGHKVIARAVAGFLLIVTVLQSLGQLGFRDILTFIVVFVIGFFYVKRMRQTNQR